MSVILSLTGKTPGQTQFGLDTFIEHYKCDATANVVLTDGSVPQMGSAHPSYLSMFVTARYCTETSESASALDLTYTGTLSGDLPARKHDTENGVQSATSSRGTDGSIAVAPISVQFYTPTNVLSYLSTGGPGSDVADDPTGALVIIALTVGDTSITAGSSAALVARFFQEQIIETHQATEIVAGQYWQNVSRKIKSYIAFVLELTPGVYISLGTPGEGYGVGDSLTISSGGEGATMDVDSLGVGNSIASFTVTSNTFTVAHNLLSATGGGGSGAVFNVFIVS